MRNRFTSFWLGFLLLVATLAPSSVFAAPYAYVTDLFDSHVSIIDLATDSVINKLSIGVDNGPKAIIMHPNRPHLYISNYTTGTVTAVDVGTPGSEFIIDEIALDTVSAGVEPEGLAFNPDGTKLYVAHGIDEDFTGVWKQFLTEINVDDTAGVDYHTISRSRQFTQNEARAPYAMEVKESAGRVKAYISGRLEDKIYVVDIENLYWDPNDETPPAFLRTINIETGSDPHGIAVSDNGLVYVACQGTDKLAVINTNITPNASIDYQLVGGQPTDVALHPSGNTAYVVNRADSTVTVVDTSITTYPVIDTVAVGALDGTSQPEYAAVGTNGQLVYVTGHVDDTLSIIETTNNTATTILTISEGDELTGGSEGVAPGEDTPFLSVLAEKNFGDVSLINPSSSSFTVTNKGTADLEISAIGGLASSVFSINPGDCLSNPLAYNETCEFTVTFAPAAVGAVFDDFDITSNADNSPTNIAVSGTGTTTGIVPTTPQTSISGTVVTGDSVTFTWTESTDPLDRTLTYLVQVSKGNLTFDEVGTEDFSFTCNTNGVILAGTGLMSVLLLGGALRARNRKMLLIASLFAATALITACGGGGGGGTGPVTPPADTVTSQAQAGLSSGTYYWRVAAVPEGGEMSTFSQAYEFTVQ